MTTALDCTIAAARSHVGVNEYPPKSNCQPFSAGLHRPCEAWCADGVCYCDHVDCGLDFAWLGLGPTGSPSCRVITVAGQRVGRFGHVPRRGCWIVFGPGGGSHIERVVAVVMAAAGPAGVDTVGFNTSAPDNYAGGTVATHRRMFGPGDDIYGFVYPPYTDPQPAPPAPTAEEDADMPFVVKKVSDPQAWLVVSDGTKLVKMRMTDANDLRNRPDGYGPIVELADAAVDGITTIG